MVFFVEVFLHNKIKAGVVVAVVVVVVAVAVAVGVVVVVVVVIVVVSIFPSPRFTCCCRGEHAQEYLYQLMHEKVIHDANIKRNKKLYLKVTWSHKATAWPRANEKSSHSQGKSPIFPGK